MENKIGEKIKHNDLEYIVIEGDRSCERCSLLTMDGVCYKKINPSFEKVFGECELKYREDGKDVYFV